MFSAGMTTTGQRAWWVTRMPTESRQQPLESAGSAGRDDEHLGVGGRIKQRHGGRPLTARTVTDEGHLALLLTLTCCFTFDVKLAARWRSGANVPAPAGLRPSVTGLRAVAAPGRRCLAQVVAEAHPHLAVDRERGGALAAANSTEATMRVVTERQLAIVLGALAGTPRVVVGRQLVTPWRALAVLDGTLGQRRARAGGADASSARRATPSVRNNCARASRSLRP